MTEGWYESVSADKLLTQGDIILDCPILTWKREGIVFEPTQESLILQAATEATAADVIVMTQACDLEHGKVSDVILCPHLPVAEYRDYWEAAMRTASQNPTDKAWKRHMNDICDGFMWNLAILNEGDCGDLKTEHRVVDFHEVYTVPRQFLESFVKQRARPRLRLLPPYREHLSQAFARFFMRVGLPVPVTGVV